MPNPLHENQDIKMFRQLRPFLNNIFFTGSVLFSQYIQLSEPQFSEMLDLMNELQLPFSYFTLYLDSI